MSKINETQNVSSIFQKTEGALPDIHDLVLHQNLLIQGLMDLLYEFVSSEMNKSSLFNQLKLLLKKHEVDVSQLGWKDDLQANIDWTVVDPKGILQSDDLHPELKSKVKTLVQKATAQGLKVQVYEGFRSVERQDKLYQDKRNITKAKGGQSYHNYGLAVDLVFRNDKNQPSWNGKHDWNTLGKIGKDLGLTWGGDFKRISDKGHFEYHPGLNLKTIRSVYKSQGIQGVWDLLL